MQNEECRIWRALTFHCALFTLNLKTGCNVSSRRPPSEGGGRECDSPHPDHCRKQVTRVVCRGKENCWDSWVLDSFPVPRHLSLLGGQADISWLHLSRKQDRHRRGRGITDPFGQFQPL